MSAQSGKLHTNLNSIKAFTVPVTNFQLVLTIVFVELNFPSRTLTTHSTIAKEYACYS